jgi:glycosyltransferase involved in cell wall biosynthesis
MGKTCELRSTGGANRRPAILVLIVYYLPGYKSGGPLHSIAGLVDALGDEFDFKIITSDRDLGDRHAYPNVRPGCWTRLGKASVLYLSPRNPFSTIWHTLKTPHDVLYAKSFFSCRFSLFSAWLHLLGILRTKTIVVAPCGEFGPGALALKTRRKRIYIRIARWMGVYARTIWHATSEYEAEDVKREFGSDSRTVTASSIGAVCKSAPAAETTPRIVVASELASVERPRCCDGVRAAKIPGRLSAVFLARVARNKNLESAIRHLGSLRGCVWFDIYGPLEDRGYWEDCRRLIAGLPANIQVQYRGSVPHDAVSRILHNYELFFFPTCGENFSYSILEALLAGLPILISDKTPWRRLPAAGVGWDLPLSEPERFRETLQRCVDMGPEEHEEMAARALEYGRRHSQDADVVARNRALFQTALGNSF